MHLSRHTHAPVSILAVEDDPDLAAHLQTHLLERGFSVVLRHDGHDVLELIQRQHFDLVLMDIMLPGASGLDVLAALRQQQCVPVILVSALGAEPDRIAGFSQGADDYLPKPFSLVEMDVRIDALLRRVAYERDEQQIIDTSMGLTFDALRVDVCNHGQWATLTPIEYRVLEQLARHPGEALSKTFLYQQVLHRAYSVHDRSLDMHISHIRRKLAAIGYPAGCVETIRGIGYSLSRADTPT